MEENCWDEACEIEIHFMAASVGGRRDRSLAGNSEQKSSGRNWRGVSNDQPNDRIKWRNF